MFSWRLFPGSPGFLLQFRITVEAFFDSGSDLMGRANIFYSDQGMTMDFSRLHIYTPPQCVPENTGYTYSLSSSYSSAALDFESQHKLEPVFDSPRMSRRSLRLATTGHFSDDGFLDSSRSKVSYSGGGRAYRTLNRTSHKQTALTSQQTPSKTQSDSSLILGQNSFHSCASDVSLMSTLLDESSIQEKTLVDSFWGLDEDRDLKGGDTTVVQGNGDLNTAETQTSMANGYICNDCSILSQRKDALTTYSSSSHSHSPTPSSTVYSYDKTKRHKSAHSSFCGSMNVKDLMTGDGRLNLNGSLCDDCKGKKHLETQTVHTRSSRFSTATRTLWHIVAYTGYYLFQAVRTVASAGWFVTKKLWSFLWLAVVSPGRAATGAFWWLGTGWYHLVTLMSLLNVFILTRCLPKLLKLLLLLIPFLLLLGLWYWSPSGLLLSLPGLSSSDRQVESDVTPTPSSALDQVATEQQDQAEAHLHPSSESVSGVFDLERVISLEKRLALLSDSCQKTSQQYDERHRQLLGLYGKLQEQLARARDEEGASTRITNLFDQRMSILKQDLQQSWEEKEQNRNEYLALHQSHESRIADLEGLLQIIAAKTEEVRQKRETSTPAAVSQESDDHSLLLSEVKRLELELNQIKADLLGVKTCHSKCEALDSLQDTVDARVREAVKTLIYGSREAQMPESLLQWLSSQYVQHGDLQGRLASLEQRVFKNITSYTSQTKQMPTAQVVTSAVNGAGVTGITEEQVHAIVNNALRLYSQDRTGLVDYALESGGGSILSTRCSETYETKTALMSLFGVPLWYFSQSPRVVIQPDVYPGNCWAFKGSQGYLVIRLSLTIIPSSFTLEHIPKALSPTGHISSAPRNFTVYGLEDEYQEEGKLLGRYTYEEDGESFQTFPVTEENDKAYQIIEVRVLSNWGHPEYTCLYRFRVHGEPYKK
ncbi:SUN domain-containing protein 1 isoform X3 [Lepisosteus oculatus]|uniref:SUN domain-containing protein 1 isoform X3 n=1 Tax=Lepisosteus oculatus TaxID=7918 RepID=UPI0035F52D3C